MPGDVPHWVLGTSNAICVGMHFYSTSTIHWSVITIVHTFLLTGTLTNEDHQETITLLYQLMVGSTDKFISSKLIYHRGSHTRHVLSDWLF